MLTRIINYRERLKTWRLKRRLKITINKSQHSNNEDITSIIETWESLQKNKNYKYDEFYNICLFSSIVGRDIRILANNYFLTENDNERSLYGRILSMTIIEFLDDINQLLGQKLRKELSRNNLNSFLADLGAINKEFSIIKKENNSELRKIRNNAAAHKTKKAKDLIDFTNKFDFDEILEISNGVSRVNIKLTELTTQIIYKITDELRSRLDELKLESKTLEENAI